MEILNTAKRILRQAYKIWMRFALILSWVTTTIILIILFYLVFMPVGLFMRLLGIDPLEREDEGDTYWKMKEKLEFNPINYERRF